MNQRPPPRPKLPSFNNPDGREYEVIRPLGKGACGETLLVLDKTLGRPFVFKEFVPIAGVAREDLFEGFLREIKLLHDLYHPNVVRVFDYRVDQNALTGHILLEYVDGKHLDEYLTERPEQINQIFDQTISVFEDLEKNNILHRDVRPSNIMVTQDGVVKVIDFGFGKQIMTPRGFDKSISLNWWCEVPEDFEDGRYDFGTEVYFVGKLFEPHARGFEHFAYPELLADMCQWSPAERPTRFSKIRSRSEQRDSLTHLYTGRYLRTRLLEEINLARERNQPFSMVIADVRSLKAINERLGHRVGDEVLRKIAGQIRRSIGESGWAARLGGDEFAIVLPGSDRRQSLVVVERIRVACASVTVTHLMKPITLSFGVSELQSTDGMVDSLMQRADADLYRAQRAGRAGANSVRGE